VNIAGLPQEILREGNRCIIYADNLELWYILYMEYLQMGTKPSFYSNGITAWQLTFFPLEVCSLPHHYTHIRSFVQPATSVAMTPPSSAMQFCYETNDTSSFISQPANLYSSNTESHQLRKSSSGFTYPSWYTLSIASQTNLYWPLVCMSIARWSLICLTISSGYTGWFASIKPNQ